MFGGLGIIAVVIILNLKETLNKPIYHQIKEVEKRNNSSFVFTSNEKYLEKTI